MEEHKSKPQDGALIVGSIEPKKTQDRATPEYPEDHDFAEDGKSELAADLLQEILDRMDVDSDVAIREDAERIVLDVTGPDAGLAIGKKGQTLDALQFILNKIVNRFPESRRHVIVDSGDYRDRHDRGLVNRARREAKRAVQEGKVITLEPMNARDRRVIHLSLAKFEGVTTCSEGEGMQRRIQIIPAQERRGGPRRRRR